MPTLEWDITECIKQCSPPNRSKPQDNYFHKKRLAITIITLDDINDAYEIIARIITVYGTQYLPIFKRLHDEVSKLRSEQELLNTAKKITEKKLCTDNNKPDPGIDLSHIFSHVSHTNDFT